MTSQTTRPPKAVGLYYPRFEHDVCGVGMVARLDNTPTHEIIERGVAALKNLEHRGVSGADPCTGDGAGILMQVHDQRFSTNTFPSWGLSHPYRTICHNGEINTVMGNVNWMRARESELSSELFGEDLQKILPVVTPGNSDSATFDNVMELLLLAGRSPAHAAMMVIPEAYRHRADLPEELKGFYAFHSCLMEPWDGPASVAFTDGRVVVVTLDRDGLRPGSWVQTVDCLVLGLERMELTWDIVRVLSEHKRATLARAASTPRAREVVTCAR
jgi:glutamate synthase domain-containing protein 1